jgi:hypothetical protein
MLSPMNAKYRVAVLFAIVFAVMAPYMGFIMYVSFKFPAGHWPMWVTNSMMVWFAASFLLVVLVAKRLFKNQNVDPERSRHALKAVRIRYSFLLVFWSGLFVYGVIRTVQGKVALNRAIPAGAFLLFFIAMFAWGLYRPARRKS